MSDERLRALEAEARAGDPAARAAWLAARCRAGRHAATMVSGVFEAPAKLPASWPDQEVVERLPNGNLFMATRDPVIVVVGHVCEVCGAEVPCPSERVIRMHMQTYCEGPINRGTWRARVGSCELAGAHVYDEGLVFTKTTEEPTCRGLERHYEVWQRCTRCEHTNLLRSETTIDRTRSILRCGHTPTSRLHGSEDACYVNGDLL